MSSAAVRKFIISEKTEGKSNTSFKMNQHILLQVKSRITLRFIKVTLLQRQNLVKNNILQYCSRAAKVMQAAMLQKHIRYKNASVLKFSVAKIIIISIYLIIQVIIYIDLYDVGNYIYRSFCVSNYINRSFYVSNYIY